MPGHIPLYALLIYLLAVLASQTSIDTYFTRLHLPGAPKRRATLLGVANTVALAATMLLMRLFMPLNHLFLLSARARGSMAVAVLFVILEYFVWVIPFAVVRGWIIQEWGMSEEIREKRQAWWSYALVGAIVTLVLMGPVFVAYNIVHPLMVGVDEVFTD